MTKVRLNLRDALCDELGGTTTHIPASVDIDELFEFSGIEDATLDLADILHKNRMIGRFQSTRDLINYRPHLTDDQAWEVLQTADQQRKSQLALDTQYLWNLADKLYPAARIKAERVARADRAIQAYGEDLAESNLIDFLTDAMHWCRQQGREFDDALRIAGEHFAAETNTNTGA